METYTLFELNEHIRRVIALNLPTPVWIRCEIAQVDSRRGHFYLELIQKEEGGQDIIARTGAAIWQSTYRKLRRKIKIQLDQLLQEGLEVKVQAKVEFHERYGLKLIIEDIDPTFTLGQMEIQRQKTIDKLVATDLMGKNSQLDLPIVLQRLAVISSESAAGLEDFIAQLNTNPYHLRFNITLFEASVQGQQAATEITRQLRKISKSSSDYDCILLLRGGGARLDLAAFDQYGICEAIAKCPLPVLTGIGHEIDETISDLVAHTSLKTPTAAAEFILNHNVQFESSLLELGNFLHLKTTHKILENDSLLERMETSIRLRSQAFLSNQAKELKQLTSEIPKILTYRVQKERQQLDQLDKIKTLLSLENTLQRGFSLTLKNGQTVQSAKETKQGDILETRLADGTIISEVKGKSKK